MTCTVKYPSETFQHAVMLVRASDIRKRVEWKEPEGWVCACGTPNEGLPLRGEHCSACGREVVQGMDDYMAWQSTVREREYKMALARAEAGC